MRLILVIITQCKNSSLFSVLLKKYCILPSLNIWSHMIWFVLIFGLTIKVNDIEVLQDKDVILLEYYAMSREIVLITDKIFKDGFE